MIKLVHSHIDRVIIHSSDHFTYNTYYYLFKQGSHFDLNGDVKDWWHPHTKQQYHDKTKCIVNQYGEFSFSDLVTNNTAIHVKAIYNNSLLK